MINKLCHFEIGVRDYPRAKDFYSKLFNWKFEMGGGGQEMIRTNDDVGGHLNTLGQAPHNYTTHNYVTFYIMVEDVSAAVARAESLGGKKIVGPVPEGGKNEFAWIADPEGNIIGVYAEKKK